MGSLDKREIGMLASYQATSYLDFRGMISNEKYGNQIDHVKLNYALADLHRVTDAGNTSYNLRVGRVKLSMGTLNDTRDNPAVRDMDFAPQGLYRDQFREMATAGDGIQVAAAHTFQNGSTLSSEVSRVRPLIVDGDQNDTVNVLLNIPQNSGKVNNNQSNIQAFSLQYTIPAAGVVLRYDKVAMNFRYEANPALFYSRFVSSGELNTIVNYYSVRKYFMNGVDVTGEMIKVDREGELWNKVLEGRNYGAPYAFSLLLRYKPCPKWTYYTNYNVWYTDITDRSGERHASIPGNPPAARYRYKDFNFGFKYSTGNGWIYKMSFHNIRGTNTLSLDDNPDMEAMVDHYRMVTASVTYVF
jgi:hypothetical protein